MCVPLSFLFNANNIISNDAVHYWYHITCGDEVEYYSITTESSIRSGDEVTADKFEI